MAGIIQNNSLDNHAQRTVPLHERKQKSQSSYLQIMNNIAEDLDFMLGDLCKTYPSGSPLKLNDFESFQFNSTVPTNNTNHIKTSGPLVNVPEIPTRNKSLNKLLVERQFKAEDASSLNFDQLSTTFSQSTSVNESQVDTICQTLQPSVNAPLAPHDEISMEQRLVHTAAVWFQPETAKSVAIHALQGTPPGSFLFRKSRNRSEIVLSIQQTGEYGCYIENYPVKYCDNGVQLAKSGTIFQSVVYLVLNHMRSKDSLPVLLRLPTQVMEACTIMDLDALNLLGIDVWLASRSFSHSKCSNQERPSSSHIQKSIPRVQSTPQLRFDALPLPMLSAVNTLDTVLQTNATQDFKRSSSYDDRNNPFRKVQADADLENFTQRRLDYMNSTKLYQPMRYSTSKEFIDAVVPTLGTVHYPPPSCPPPPPPPSKLIHSPPFSKAAIQSQSSGEYYDPFETIRPGHRPPSCFGISQDFITPDLPPKKCTTNAPGQAVTNRYSEPSMQTDSAVGYNTPTQQPGNPFASSLQAPLQSWQQIDQAEFYKLPSSNMNIFNPERDSGIQESAGILEPQRISSTSPMHDLFASFDPLAVCNLEAERDSGVYANPHISAGDLMSVESRKFVHVSDSTLKRTPETPHTPLIGNEDDGQCAIETTQHLTLHEPVTHRQNNQQIQEHPVDEANSNPDRSSVASSASSGERFSLLSSSSNDDLTKRSGDELTSKASKTSFKKRFNKTSLFKLKPLRTSFIKTRNSVDPVRKIEESVIKTSQDSSKLLCRQIEEFINCTGEMEHTKPEKLMHSIRQFITGLKNYLNGIGEKKINEVIKKYADKLNASEDLSVDAIIEGALYQSILKPLKKTIYATYLHDYKRNGSLSLLEEKMAAARSHTKEQLGIKPNFVPPSKEEIQDIKKYFDELEEVYSPYDKMDVILQAVTSIYSYVGVSCHGRDDLKSMGADDFLPMLIYVLVHCNITTIEIETDYIWSLLESSAHTGEGAYYLTMLTSAIHVLKNVEYFEGDGDEIENKEENGEVEEAEKEISLHRSASIVGTRGFLEVFVMTQVGVFQQKLLPVWPGMTSKQICRNLALKNHIEQRDWDNFGLFQLLRDKEGLVTKETLLPESECPQKIKNEIVLKGMFCDFGFKQKFYRADWPKNDNVCFDGNSDEDETDTLM